MKKRSFWSVICVLMLAAVILVGCDEEPPLPEATEQEVIEDPIEDPTEETTAEDPIAEDPTPEPAAETDEKSPVEVVEAFVETANTDARSEEDEFDIDSYELIDYTDNFGTIFYLELSTYSHVEVDVLDHEVSNSEAEVRGVLLKESPDDVKDNEYIFYLEYKTTEDFDTPRWLVTRISQETGHMQ